MKSRTVKLISAIMAVLIFAAVFVSCRSGGGTAVTDGTGGKTNGTTDSPTTDRRHESGTPGVVDAYWPDYGDFEKYAGMRERLEKWLVDNYINGTKAPFSFTYNNLPSEIILAKWERKTSEDKADGGKKYTVSYTNPADGFRVWAEFTLFGDYPTLEWCTYAENGGSENSKKLRNFMGMDISFELDSSSLTLHTTEGSLDIAGDDINDYRLVTEKLTNKVTTFMPEENDGRSSEHAWPFFDVVGNGNGIMFGIGWTGLWTANFSAEGNNVNISSGMAKFSSYLKPQEKVRTPLYSITYFDGDAEYGHNLFRRTVLAHYTPDDGTDDVCKLPVSVTTESYGESGIIDDVSKWTGKLSIDNVWTDAAWFGDTDKKSWTVETGNWWINKRLYPSGSLKKVSDFLHSNNLKYTVWFELERVAVGTELYREHFDLLINRNVVGSYILNLASEEGYRWAENYLIGMIRENGIDIYRQDFNSPGIAQAWAANDEPDRDGMTELRYVENLYRLYDRLHREFPGIMLDNCASGGKRIDLEMLKRMVILHRTDYTCVPYGDGEGQFNMEGIQWQNQNLSYWLPLHGATLGYPVYLFEDSYLARSMLSAGVALGIQVGYAADKPLAQKMTREMSDFRGYFIGDYYPLLEPTYDKTSKQAFMYVREDINEALVLVYNRPQNSESTRFTLKLRGLDPDTTYIVTDQDARKGQAKEMTGEKLMNEGIDLNVYSGSAKILLLTPIN